MDEKQLTKICTKCHREKPIEAYHRAREGKGGRRAQCKVCVGKVKAAAYAAKAGKVTVKAKPMLLSWQPEPGDLFDASLGGVGCVLNPFRCTKNGERLVIATNKEGKWKLDKSEYIFQPSNRR
jgi:hypothetical protein